IQASAEGVLRDVLRRLPLDVVEVDVRGTAWNDVRVRSREPRSQTSNSRDRPRPCRGARDLLDEVPSGVQAVSFVAAEEECLVLENRSTEGAAELIQLERRLGRERRAARLDDDAVVGVAERVEVIGSVELVAAQILEHRAVELIATRLGDHA